jgi:hypothetical protein
MRYASPHSASGVFFIVLIAILLKSEDRELTVKSIYATRLARILPEMR